MQHLYLSFHLCFNSHGPFSNPNEAEKSIALVVQTMIVWQGTEFMDRLAVCLRYYIHDRVAKDPGWAKIQVILSDAQCPGEGEHKIMDYIRRQRGQPDHDPNTHHCLCGADADLIMLGLATHEPHFTIIREEFKMNKPRPCELCGQVGKGNNIYYTCSAFITLIRQLSVH